MGISERKLEHIHLALDESTQYKESNGLELVKFIHNALPELNYEEIDTKAYYFNHAFSYPIMILGMTGGHEESLHINIKLAKLASKYNIPFGVGSQRVMIKNPKLSFTYNVKEHVEDVFLVGNIGGAQLIEYPIDIIKDMADKTNLDALAVHLNPLQELVQPEGDKNFFGIKEAIKDLIKELDIPIIVKEVGAGISRDVAKSLKSIGLEFLDVSGKGGTSWAKIEYKRGKGDGIFGEWGAPTALAILMCKDLMNILASGGIRTGLDVAKAIALGASFTGAAQPFLKALYEKKEEEFLLQMIKELKIAMLLTKSRTIKDLRNAKYYTIGWLNTVAKDLGLEYYRF